MISFLNHILNKERQIEKCRSSVKAVNPYPFSNKKFKKQRKIKLFQWIFQSFFSFDYQNVRVNYTLRPANDTHNLKAIIMVMAGQDNVYSWNSLR